ncbi:MAG TPA: hypothetical protein VGH28_15355 [Polyangiaceae bacterium]|jgi:hypothetical protein
MTKIRTALILIALATATTAARAEEVTDPITDFRMELDVRGREHCVVLPRDRQEGSFCLEMGAGSLAESLDRSLDQPIYAVFARDDDGFFVVSVTREGVRDPIRADQLAEFAASVRTQIASGAQIELADDLPPPTLEQVKGVTMVVVPMRGQVHDAEEHAVDETLICYTLFGSRASYRIVTNGDTAHASDAERVVRAALQTLTLAPAAVAAPKPTGLGDLRAHARAVAIAAVVLLALVFGAWRFMRDPPAPDAPDGPRFRTRKRKVVSWQKSDRS